MTLEGGGQVRWSITGASGTTPTQAVTSAAPEETQVPDLTGGPVAVALVDHALVDQALVAVAMAGDVVRVDRYSTRPGAARPEQPYQPLSHM